MKYIIGLFGMCVVGIIGAGIAILKAGNYMEDNDQM